jgi:hypothetical protein
MEYVIVYKYKASWFWKKQKVTGHSYNKEVDKLVLFKKDGSLEEVAEWSKHHVKLGVDFVAAQKKQMEKETGTDIKLNV